MIKSVFLLTTCILSLASGAPGTFSIPFPTSDVLLDHPSGRPFTITVEGNIGAGKSTLLNFFMKYPDIAVHKEPLDIWQNLNGTNFLELVYKDQSRWGMTFESLVTLTMMEVHLADRGCQVQPSEGDGEEHPQCQGLLHGAAEACDD